MRYCSGKITWLFVALIIVLLGGGAGAVTQIDSCTTIFSPGAYLLNQSIINSTAASCINIVSSDVVFDGAGYTIDGVDTYNTTYGVYVYNSTTSLTNVTVKNLKVMDWAIGIYLENSNYNTLNGNIVNFNRYNGIDLVNSSYNRLNNNTASNNSGNGIQLFYFSNNNNLSSNTANSNYLRGIYIYISSNNNLIGNAASNNSVGILNYESSNNNLIGNNLTGNNASNLGYGIHLYSSSNNNLINNIISKGENGIKLESSSNNNLIGNTANFNKYNGIYLYYSSNNYFTSNVANSNNNYGIILHSSSNNTLADNNVLNNNYGISLEISSNNNDIIGNIANFNNIYGIYLYSSSSNNNIYNNHFNNTNNFGFSNTNRSIWNTTKTSGINIIGGPYIGGNFWAYPNGTGFSQTCTDTNGDGICDTSYTLNTQNIDYLPLSTSFTLNITPLTSTVGYSALIATGQNTYVQSSNGSFGLLLKGQTKTINNSVILNNTGDISAKVEARFNDSIGGVFGLISGTNVLNATNFALGLPSALVPLSSLGANVQVAVAPPGATALDARLSVPGEQVAGDYSGTVILTFSNNV